MLFAELETVQEIREIFAGLIEVLKFLGGFAATVGVPYLMWRATQGARQNDAIIARQARTAKKLDTGIDKIEDAAKNAAEVKTALDEQKAETAKVNEASVEACKLIVERIDQNTELTKATHSLVNGPMTAEKRKVYELAQWKADHTGKPEDFRSAEEAKERLRQAIARDQPGYESGIFPAPKTN